MDENQQIEQPQPNEQQVQPVVAPGQDLPQTPYEAALRQRLYTQLLVAKLRGEA